MVYQLVCIIGVSSDVLIQNSRKIALQYHLKCWQTITRPLTHPKSWMEAESDDDDWLPGLPGMMKSELLALCELA